MYFLWRIKYFANLTQQHWVNRLFRVTNFVMTKILCGFNYRIMSKVTPLIEVSKEYTKDYSHCMISNYEYTLR